MTIRYLNIYLKSLPNNSYTSFFLSNVKKNKDTRKRAIKHFLDSTRPDKKRCTITRRIKE